MDDYIIFVDKTVRDIFKNSDIQDIKKYKLKKAQEIQILSNELKKEVLDKYPSLVNNITSIANLSMNLIELENTLEEIKIKINKTKSNKSFISNISDPHELLTDLSLNFEKNYINYQF